MKLTLKSLEYTYDIAPYEMDCVDDDCIISLTESGKVISMNPVASYVWKKVIEKHGEQSDISDESIVADILKDFNLHSDEYNNVSNDVNYVFGLLLNSSLLLTDNCA